MIAALAPVAPLLLGLGFDPAVSVLARPGPDATLGIEITTLDLSDAIGRQVAAGFTPDGSPWFLARARLLGSVNDASVWLVLPEEGIAAPVPASDLDGEPLRNLDLRRIESDGRALAFAQRFLPNGNTDVVTVEFGGGLPDQVRSLSEGHSSTVLDEPARRSVLGESIVAFAGENNWFVKDLTSPDAPRRLDLDRSEPRALLPDGRLLTVDQVQLSSYDLTLSTPFEVCIAVGISSGGGCTIPSVFPGLSLFRLLDGWSVSADGDLAAVFDDAGRFRIASGPFDTPQQISEPSLGLTPFAVDMTPRPASAWTAVFRGEPGISGLPRTAVALRTTTGEVRVPVRIGDPSPGSPSAGPVVYMPAVLIGAYDQILAVLRGPTAGGPAPDEMVFLDGDGAATTVAAEGAALPELDPTSPVTVLPTGVGPWPMVSDTGRAVLPVLAESGAEAMVLVTGTARSPCSIADATPPFGVVNFADIQAFAEAFAAARIAADLNGDGLINTADVQAFVQAFPDLCG